MTEADDPRDRTDDLRRRAEELARKRAAEAPLGPALPSPEAAGPLLHELQVHQLELEMQNDELRRAQEALEASRARYFDLYDLAPIGYFTLSEHGLILEANLTGARLLAGERRSLVRQPLSRFILPEDQDAYYRHRQQLEQTGAPQVCELRMQPAHGASFWARLEAAPARGADGEPVWRVVVSDVSERKQLEEVKAKREDEERQLQKAESLGRMAGAIAHHFNNQLQAVMGNLELATRGAAPDAVLARYLAAATRAALQAAEVVGQTLTYLGETPVAGGPLDLCEVCRRGLPVLRAAMPKGAVLEARLPLASAITGNANQIQQVLTNLVTNAWEALPDGQGAIRLTVSTVSPSEIPARHRFPVGWQPQAGAYACLELTDTGCGIADEEIEKVFDPFFTSKFVGRGLGLPVVLGIVRTHGGAITVASEPGRGSSIRVFLPASVEQAPRQTIETQQPSAGLEGGGGILLVDDEDGVRRVTAAMLAHLGFEVLEAAGGAEALEVYRLHQGGIRCVVCDLTMPRMNGWETLAALQRLSPGLPVILASGYGGDEVLAEPRLERPAAFLAKPFGIQQLADAIGQALAPKKS